MPRQVEMRREHLLRERAFREREQSFEAWCLWYVFDPAATVMDNVYDESGERKFKAKANVPILWWFDEEGGDRLTGEGRTLWRTMHMAVTVGALRNAGVDPESDDRVNDMIKFRGWFWDVVDFTLTSQSSLVNPDEDNRGDDSTVRVVARRRFPASDMPHDFFPGAEPDPGP